MRKAILLALATFIFIIPAQSALAFDPNYKFTDQLNDSESGLYNFGSRTYNPATGRFNQPDPLLNELNQQMDFLEMSKIRKANQNLERLLMNPQQLNYYSYSVNNPLIYTDPTGKLQIHFNKDMTEEQKQQFMEGLKYLQEHVKDNQQIQDYFKKFDVDIVEILEDNSKGPDVYFKKEMKDSEGNDLYGGYNSLTNNVLINFETIIDGLQAVASTLIHELGHWANDIADWWFNLNPNVSEYGFTDYIRNYVTTNFIDGESYYKRDKIYGFLAEMLTFGFIF